MCRIAGFRLINKTVQPEDVLVGQKMRDVLAYGGPDDSGEYISKDDGLFLGHRRLSVIDTSSDGHQPMINKEWVVIFNGEIYNYKEVQSELILLGMKFSSNSDTEVLLKAFEKWGYDAVQKFRGMFAFVLWNTKTKKLLLCRDRVGVKPLYWYLKDGIFLFGSELKALRQFREFDTSINHDAVSIFLKTGYIKAPHSIFTYAHKLDAGAMLEIDEHGETRKWKYWDVNSIQCTEMDMTDESVLGMAEKLLIESCNYRMVSDVPIGIFLSGGIDSSLVTAILQNQSDKPIKTFTIGFDNNSFDESVYAKKVSGYFKTDHYELICSISDFKRIIPELPNMYDEPFGDSSAIPTHMVSLLAKGKVTVALSADGGDEVFSGYLKYKATSDYYGKIKNLPIGIREQMAKFLLNLNQSKMETIFAKARIPFDFNGLQWRLPKFANALRAPNQLKYFELSSSYITSENLHKLHYHTEANLYEQSADDLQKNFLYSFLGKVDIGSYLEGDILTKVDRASMAVALEGREPLLDHKLIEFGLSLPDKYKIRNGQTKWILRNVLYKYIPKELVERPKQGFAIPIKEWLQSELKDELLELVNNQQFANLFKLNKEEIRIIINSFLAGDKRSSNPHFIWFLYTLYAWYKRWI